MTHLISPPITATMDNVIVGTILGGSSIICPSRGKNCYLSMRSRNLDWLRYKATLLAGLASADPITAEKTYRWHSMCYPIFKTYREKFYKDGKRSLRLEAFENITATAFSIWYGDCGKIKDRQVILNTQIWGEKGSKVVAKYFRLLDYKPTFFKERGSCRIKLDDESSYDFLKLAVKTLPNFMRSQIPYDIKRDSGEDKSS